MRPERQTRRSRRANSFRPDIQGLRALAVGVVILDHAVRRPPGGYIGVDVFFVISGFLITSLLWREYEREGTISFRGFYARRFRRIVPAASLVLIVTVAASHFLLSRGRAASATLDAIWSFVFLGNWRMAGNGTDYFQQSLPPSPLQNYWSLSVEEQFYLVWPWLMLAVLLLLARYTRSSESTRRIALIAVIGTLSAASLAWSVAQTNTDPHVAYFSTLTRFWELGVGAIVALATVRFNWRSTAVRIVLGLGGLGAIVWSAVFFSDKTPYPGLAAALPVLGAAAIMVAGAGTPTRGYCRAMFPLVNPVARYLGDISYSLYLWHFPVTLLLLAVFPRGPVYYAFVFGGTLLLSVLSYRFVETPVRESRWLERRPRSEFAAPHGALRNWSVSHRPLAITLAALVTVALVGVGVPGYATISALADGAGRTTASTAIGPCDGVAAIVRQADCAGKSSETLLPDYDTIAYDFGNGFGQTGCFREHHAPVRACTMVDGKGSDPFRVAIVGDSHAAMYVPALSEIAQKNDWQLDVYVGWGCHWTTPRDDCQKQQAVAQAAFTGDTPYDLIITSSSRLATSDWTGADTQAAAETWSEAARSGSKIIVIADDIQPSVESVTCVRPFGFDPRHNGCGTKEAEGAKLNDGLLDVAAQVPEASILNVNDLLCTDGWCPATIGSVVVYRDAAGHVTSTYVLSMVPELEKRLAPLMGAECCKSGGAS
jgi:peptidoglycan/LPS O-acetylase OafA/YrhL